MKHPQYGNLANIYYHKHSNRYYVRFRREGQFFVSPYYRTVEEAIEAKRLMQYIVPKSKKSQLHKQKVCDYTQPTWYLRDYLNGKEQHITNTNIANLPQSVNKQTVRFENKEQQLKVNKNNE